MTGDRQIPFALCLLLWAATVPAQPVVEVQISGVDGALLDNVRAHLGIFAYDRKPVLMKLPEIGADALEEPLTEGALRRLHQRARGEILQALQPFGYYQPVIDASLKRSDGIWHAGYRIDAGPATLIGSVDIALEGEGREEAPVREALQASRLKGGQQLQHSDYEDTAPI
jgi:translocation and assembly module TamA